MIKKIKQFTLLVICIVTAQISLGQTKIIFDTDFGGDADDLGALAMLHHFKNQGECDLLAIMLWSTEKWVVPAVNAVNIFYKNPHIPIGIRNKEQPEDEQWRYNKPLAKTLPYELTNKDVPLAVDLYRKILSAQEDKSVTIVTVGPLKNIQNLLFSPPDAISDLTGKELLKAKVKEMVIMGGEFPEGEWEWNFFGDMPGVTKFVLEKLPVPVVFSGYEIGVQIKTGPEFHNLSNNHPLYVAYKHFSEHAPWMKEYYTEGKITPNSTYDQTAVLYAVRNGLGKYWTKEENGYCLPDKKGGNVWVEVSQDVETKHAYLVLKKDPKKMEEIITNLMIGDF